MNEKEDSGKEEANAADHEVSDALFQIKMRLLLTFVLNNWRRPVRAPSRVKYSWRLASYPGGQYSLKLGANYLIKKN